MKKYTIELESNKSLEKAMFDAYMDIKRILFVGDGNIPKTMTKVNCDCDTDVYYRVSGV